MSIADEIINNPHYKFYKEIFEQLDSKTLRLAVSDRLTTLEYAKKFLEQEQPEMLNNNEHMESMVTEMQKVAQIILDYRSEQK